MTCNILEGYVSETAKNCVANPPWGEGCEICVKSPFFNIYFLTILCLLIIGIGLCILYLISLEGIQNFMRRKK